MVRALLALLIERFAEWIYDGREPFDLDHADGLDSRHA